LLRAYRDIAKRADPEFDQVVWQIAEIALRHFAGAGLHGEIADYGVLPGRFADCGRPGYFYANTYDLKTRPNLGDGAVVAA